MYTKYGNKLRSKRDHTLKIKSDNIVRRRAKEKKIVQFPEDLVIKNFSENVEIGYEKSEKRLKLNTR